MQVGEAYVCAPPHPLCSRPPAPCPTDAAIMVDKVDAYLSEASTTGDDDVDVNEPEAYEQLISSALDGAITAWAVLCKFHRAATARSTRTTPSRSAPPVPSQPRAR